MASRSAAAPSKGDRTRADILDALNRLLRDHSVGELTVGRISAAAGVARSGFYFYFDSKFAAVAAALAEAWDDLELGTDSLASRAPDVPVPVFVDGLLRVAFTVWQRHAPLANALTQGRDHDPQLRELWDQWMGAWARRCTALVEAERDAGQARPASGEVADLVDVLLRMTAAAFHDVTAFAVPAAQAERTVQAVVATWLATLWGLP